MVAGIGNGSLMYGKIFAFSCFTLKLKSTDWLELLEQNKVLLS